MSLLFNFHIEVTQSSRIKIVKGFGGIDALLSEQQFNDGWIVVCKKNDYSVLLLYLLLPVVVPKLYNQIVKQRLMLCTISTFSIFMHLPFKYRA